ncbi:MAG: hypothetical protein ACAH88_01880, partial [Roseimicrobium sp.]
REALKRPQCRWPLEYELGVEMELVHLSCFQQLANNTRGWIAALAAKGDATAYTELLTTMLDLERCVGKNSAGLISHMVGSTMLMTTLRAWQDSLPLVSLNEHQLFQLQSRLERLTLRDGAIALQRDNVLIMDYCTRVAVTERARLLDTLRERPRRWPEKVWPLEDRVFAILFTTSPNGWHLADMAVLQEALRSVRAGCVDEEADVLSKPHVDAMKSTAEGIAVRQGWYTYSRHALVDAVSISQKILIRTANTQATVRSAIAWCAAERFRLRHGRLPQSQEELVPVFLKSALSDPVDGRPLRFMMKEDGSLVIYSLGWDGKDDGGVRTKRPSEGDFGWASDPMLLASPDEIREWAEEDKERADRANSSRSAIKPTKSKIKIPTIKASP